MPGAVILALADEPKLLSHEYDTPPLAVTLIVGVAQVSIVVPVLFVIDATGSAFTVMVAAAFVKLLTRLQPLASVIDVKV